MILQVTGKNQNQKTFKQQFRTKNLDKKISKSFSV